MLRGVSWQVVPSALAEMLADTDAGKAKRVIAAMLKMKKIRIATYEPSGIGLADTRICGTRGAVGRALRGLVLEERHGPR